jgi:hypothetical protein
MATLADLLTIARTDVLKDSGSTQKWSDDTLTRYLNAALRLSWPNYVHVKVTDSSNTTAQTAGAGTYTNTRYSLPSLVKDNTPWGETGPIYKVELGPQGGERVSDALAFSDRWRTVQGIPGLGKGWSVDWDNRQLVLHQTPPYDPSGTYTHYVRISYIRPVTALSASTDVLEAPDNFIEPLMEYVRYQATRQRMYHAQADIERLQSLGQIGNQAITNFGLLCQQYGCRMRKPRVIR